MLSVQTQQSIEARKRKNQSTFTKIDFKINSLAKYAAVAAIAYLLAQVAQAAINYWFGV